MHSVVRKIMIGMLLLGAFGLLLLTTVGVGKLGWSRGKDADQRDPQTPAAPLSPVSVRNVRLESIEITDHYAGMIRPFERFTLGFEVGGRVAALGVSASGAPLDNGDRVDAGQVLAELDRRAFQARVEETRARAREAEARQIDARAKHQQAEAEWGRMQRVRAASPEAVTESQYQAARTDLEVAGAQLAAVAAQLEMYDAQLDQAEKSLEDAKLYSPVTGVISRRMVNPGESVDPHQPAFEVLLVDDLLLVAGVPEAYVGEIRRGQPVYVEMLARNRFGRERERHSGAVYRVAEAADDTSGLFSVEVLLKNENGSLRPGMIGLARIVVDRVEGYRIPQVSAVTRQDSTVLFAVDEAGIARAYPLAEWIEQGDELIVLDLPKDFHSIVTRGQHRLVDGTPVRLVEPPDSPRGAASQDRPAVAPAAG